jgi:sodium-dependent dicarboxylate transporter 2/3/5
VLVVFTLTALCWIFKDLINKLQELVKLDDTIIAIAGSVLLFTIPSKSVVDPNKKLLEWEDTQKMAWGILLLFGGGISLANQLEQAGLIQQIGKFISEYASSNLLVLIFAVAFISIFISELMSNVAQVIVFAPVVAGIADALNISPIILGMPMTLGASCASMLPMGTPPNAIVFASGKLKLNDMLKTGLVMNIVSTILITLFCYYLVPLILK